MVLPEISVEQPILEQVGQAEWVAPHITIQTISANCSTAGIATNARRTERIADYSLQVYGSGTHCTLEKWAVGAREITNKGPQSNFLGQSAGRKTDEDIALRKLVRPAPP